MNMCCGCVVNATCLRHPSFPQLYGDYMLSMYNRAYTCITIRPWTLGISNSLLLKELQEQVIDIASFIPSSLYVYHAVYISSEIFHSYTYQV